MVPFIGFSRVLEVLFFSPLSAHRPSFGWVGGGSHAHAEIKIII
jgi:hypothetical protein